MPTTTGLVRILGPLVQSRVQELRRTAAVAVSDVVEESTAAGSYSRTVSVLRRAPGAGANAAMGRSGTWTTVAGLTGLVAHVRTAGEWKDEATGAAVQLREGERIVLIADIPAAGQGSAGDLLATDRLTWTDSVYNADAVFEIVSLNVRNPDGLVVALCRWAREGA